jgi:hypothetical protein
VRREPDHRRIYFKPIQLNPSKIELSETSVLRSTSVS